MIWVHFVTPSIGLSIYLSVYPPLSHLLSVHLTLLFCSTINISLDVYMCTYPKINSILQYGNGQRSYTVGLHLLEGYNTIANLINIFHCILFLMCYDSWVHISASQCECPTSDVTKQGLDYKQPHQHWGLTEHIVNNSLPLNVTNKSLKKTHKPTVFSHSIVVWGLLNITKL